MLFVKNKTMNSDTIFIITSVINFTDKKLSYSDVRSVFSANERKEQTIKTIESIRHFSPNSKIYFLEQGIIDIEDDNFKQLVDFYQYIGKNKIIRFCTDSPFKGFGEAIGLLLFFLKNDLEAQRYFKISGRYYLNEKFVLSTWRENGFTFLKTKIGISTRLYSFTKNVIYFFCLSLIVSIPFLLLNRSLEQTLFWFLPKRKINFKKEIGVSGKIAVLDSADFELSE